MKRQIGTICQRRSDGAMFVAGHPGHPNYSGWHFWKARKWHGRIVVSEKVFWRVDGSDLGKFDVVSTNELVYLLQTTNNKH